MRGHVFNSLETYLAPDMVFEMCINYKIAATFGGSLPLAVISPRMGTSEMEMTRNMTRILPYITTRLSERSGFSIQKQHDTFLWINTWEYFLGKF